MRQIISGVVAVLGLAVAGTAPAAACGYTPCGSPAYFYQPAYTYQPAYPYTYCGSCGAAYERLVEPTTQYYYVNQGPTYSGPGAFAPYPAYRESALPVYGYGYTHYYHGAGVAGPAVYGHRTAYRWGHSRYYHGRPVLRRYD